jgi:ABC-type nitrate/sulfonate/bicarbonate transport system substrate-binding protein
MKRVRFVLLRGVCQIPAYVAHDEGFFSDEGVDAEVRITPTAWLAPEQILSDACQFAVIPWTRVAEAEKGEAPLKLLCGSGHEEAAIVVRRGLDPSAVRTIAVPREGGMKDLTAMALLDSLGWEQVRQLRYPSGDGAIIALFGQGADAASMVEPYATLMEELQVGTVIRRTGEIWPGAPGCSLCASAAFIEREPDIVQRVVNAFVRGVTFTNEHPDRAAEIAEPYIGVSAAFIRRALAVNRPSVDTVRNERAMGLILELMKKLGYIHDLPRDYRDLRFLDRALATLPAPSGVEAG